MTAPVLTPAEKALLREVRLSDEDHGGLGGDELSADEYPEMERLCALGLVEALGEYGEAPDGEEDEREAGGTNCVYRITAAGVAALADDPPAGHLMPRGAKSTKAPTRAVLHEAALAYLTRSAATAAMLTRTLRRRVANWARRAGLAAEADAEAIAADVAACHETIEALVARFREVGLINDTAYAEARARSLARSGRSRRAITAKLAAKGVKAEIVRAAVPNDAAIELVAAVTFARKRRVGPYSRDEPADRDEKREARRRALAAFGRAGFGFATAERVLDLDREGADELLTNASERR